MKKILKLISILFLTILFVVGCGKKDEKVANENISITVGAPKAPPVLPILRMIETNAMGKNVNINIKFWQSPENLISMVQSKEAQVFAFPLTVVSKLYNKGMGVQLLNVNTWGVSYFLSADKNVKSLYDIKGKTIYIPLKSSPPDVFTKYFLAKKGLKENIDYKVIYVNKAELASLMIAGKAKYGTLIEPLVTMVEMKNPSVKTVTKFNTEWQKLEGKDSNIPTAGIGVLKDFANANQKLMEKFNTEYEKALKWVVNNPVEAGKLAEAKLGIKAKVVEKAIPNMGLQFVAAKDVKPTLDKYYQLLFNYDPKTVGGKIPNEGMYFEK